MSELTKRLIAVGVAVIGLAALVYGSYLPYRKSTMFITAIQTTQSAKTLQDFLVPYMAALDAPSPIGQQELIRNFGGTVAGIATNLAQQHQKLNPELLRALGATLDNYALPVIEKRSGTSQAQTYYALAQAYDALDSIDDTREFRSRTDALLHRGLELSPDRPQFLYLLVDFNEKYGDEAEELKYAQRIIQLWPNDPQMQKLVNRITNGQGR